MLKAIQICDRMFNLPKFQMNFCVLIYVVTRYVQLKRNLDDQKRNAARIGGDPDRVYKYRKDKITAVKTM